MLEASYWPYVNILINRKSVNCLIQETLLTFPNRVLPSRVQDHIPKLQPWCLHTAAIQLGLPFSVVPIKSQQTQMIRENGVFYFYLTSLHKPQLGFAMQHFKKILWTCTDWTPGLCMLRGNTPKLCRSAEVNFPRGSSDVFLIDSSFDFGSFPGIRFFPSPDAHG